MLDGPSPALLGRWFTGDEVCSVARLDGGTVNDVYRLDTTRGTFVLRLGIDAPGGDHGRAADAARCEHMWLSHIAVRLPEVPAPLPARDGETAVVADGRVATLTPYIAGDAPTRLRADHRAAAAHALARIHHAAATVPDPLPRPGWPAWHALRWERNARWSWPEIRRVLPGAADAPDRVNPGAIASSLELHLAVLPVALHELTYRAWAQHPLHGDYSEANLRVQGEHVVGVFDWDECRLDWRACDVADAAFAFTRHVDQVAHPGFDADAARTFLDDYRDAGGALTAEERGVLVLLMRVRRLWEALAHLGDWMRGDEIGWDYLAANVATLDALDGEEGL